MFPGEFPEPPVDDIDQVNQGSPEAETDLTLHQPPSPPALDVSDPEIKTGFEKSPDIERISEPLGNF